MSLSVYPLAELRKQPALEGHDLIRSEAQLRVFLGQYKQARFGPQELSLVFLLQDFRDWSKETRDNSHMFYAVHDVKNDSTQNEGSSKQILYRCFAVRIRGKVFVLKELIFELSK